MKYTLIISAIAYHDIIKIHDYIALDKPIVAKKIATKILDAIECLGYNPFLGVELKNKFDINTDLKCKIVNPYIVIYKVETNIVKIYRVLDGRSDYLSLLNLKNNK